MIQMLLIDQLLVYVIVALSDGWSGVIYALTKK